MTDAHVNPTRDLIVYTGYGSEGPFRAEVITDADRVVYVQIYRNRPDGRLEDFEEMSLAQFAAMSKAVLEEGQRRLVHGMLSCVRGSATDPDYNSER